MSTDIAAIEATSGATKVLPGKVHAAAVPPVIFLLMTRKKPLPAPVDASFETFWAEYEPVSS